MARTKHEYSTYALLIILFLGSVVAVTAGVNSISQGTGMLFSVNPIVNTGTINAAEATTTTIGSIKVANCTAGKFLYGWDALNVPLCSAAALGSGTVTQVDSSQGILLNPTSITSTGYILLKNATSSTIGGIMTTNCSAGYYLNGFNSSSGAQCIGQNVNGTVTSVGTGTGLSGGPITTTGTITLNEATTTTIGGLKAKNCSGTDKLNGIDATGVFTCGTDASGSGTVTSVASGTGLGGGPVTTTGTLYLNNATTTIIGGIETQNCTAGSFVNGFNSTSGATCGAGNSGTVTSITSDPTITLNPTTITTTGKIMASNATTTVQGAILVANCSAGSFFNIFGATNQPQCGTAVTSIATGTGLTGGTITGTGTISIVEGTLTALGGTQETNCSSGYYLNGWNATGKPNCVGELNNGTVTSIATSTGLSGGTITSTGTLSLLEALTTTIGGIKVLNCTAGQYIQGFTAGVVPNCVSLGNGNGIKQITIGTGLGGNESPLYTNGTIYLNNATTTAIGGVEVANCSASNYVNGWSAGQTPSCSQPVTSLTANGGITLSPSTITTTGVIMVSNATTSTQGAVLVSNCTAGQFFIGYSATNVPLCSGIPQQAPWIANTQRRWGMHEVYRLAATTWTNLGAMGGQTASGTQAPGAGTRSPWDKFTAAGGATTYDKAGVALTTYDDTKANYAPLWMARINTSNDMTTAKLTAGLTSAAGLFNGNGLQTTPSDFAIIKYDANLSTSNFYCCTNSASAGGTCNQITGVSMANNAEYNITINMTTRGQVICGVQSATAYGSFTASSNTPAGGTSLGTEIYIVNVSNTAVKQNISILYDYFEDD